MNCPRCGSQTLVRACGGGAECLSCDYRDVQDDLELYAEVMAAVPGAPLTRLGRYEEEMQVVASDAALAREAAKRHGVSLEDLRQRMHWKRTPLEIRCALHAAICDLTISGLNILRVAQVLDKSPRTITKSPGLARGRAKRRRDG